MDLITHKSTASHDVLTAVHHTALERFKMSQRLIDNCDCLGSDVWPSGSLLSQQLCAVDARHIHGKLLALSLLFKKSKQEVQLPLFSCEAPQFVRTAVKMTGC